MLKCPICDVDLSEASLSRGRCQSCGGLLVWDDEGDASSAAPSGASDRSASSDWRATVDWSAPGWKTGSMAPPARREDAAPPIPRLTDSNPSLQQILQVIVDRGRGVEAAPPPVAASPPGPPDSGPAEGASPLTPASRTGDPGQTTGLQLDQVSQIWRQSIVDAVTPGMTLKSAASGTVASTSLVIQSRNVLAAQDAISRTADYELLNVIGEGGVGVVYAARQASINRTVALKMLKPQIKDDLDHRAKFLSEAVVTGDLEHPNIVPIYDLGSNDSGALFYAMKRVHGTPWSDVIGTTSLAENLRILMSVSDAIAFAHARGIIHRDLKPENIMLGDFGEVLVMDWGIALSTPMFLKSDSITQSTSMGGTPAYMAPEMATGPLEAIGPISDVYLLGALLFEIVTGRSPHTGVDVLSCIHAAARNELQPTDKSGELLDIAYRALATRPADRYASVQEFQAAIRAYQSHSESIVLSARAEGDLAKARQSRDYQDYSRALFAFQEAGALWQGNAKAGTGVVETQAAYAGCALEKGDFDLGLSLLDPQQPAHRGLHAQLVAAERERATRNQRLRNLKRLAFLLAGLTFAVLTVGLIWVGLEKHRADLAAERAQKSAKAEKRAAEGQRIAAAEARKSAQKARDAEAEARDAAQKARDAEADAEQAAKNEKKAADQARLQQRIAEEASYVAQIGLAAERIASNAFLDAERVLRVYEQPDKAPFRNWEWGHLRHLCRLDSLAQLDRPPLKMEARIETVAWSRDGRFLLAGAADGAVQVWDAKSYALLTKQSHGTAIWAVAISDDGLHVAAGGESPGETTDIHVWQLSADGRHLTPERTLTGHRQTVLTLDFSPDQTRLLSSSRDETARLWDLKTGAQQQAFRGHFGPVWSAAFAPDGLRVVTAGDDATVRVWSVSTGEVLKRFRGHPSAVYTAAFSPDGQRVASAGRDTRILVWEPDRVEDFDFAALQRQLASELAEAASSPAAAPSQRLPVQVLQGHAAEIWTLAFGSRFGEQEGSFLLSGSHDNTVRVWNLQVPASAPDYVQIFRGHGGWVRSAAFSPDGRYVISGAYDSLVKIWDAEHYEEVRVLRGQDSPLAAAAFAPDGARVLTGGRDGVAWLWNLAGGPPTARLSESPAARTVGEPPQAGAAAPGARLREGHDFLVSAAAFFPDGDQRVLTSAGDNTVRLWDWGTGGQIRRLEHTGQACALVLSDDARWILTGSDNQSALLWDVAEAQAPPVTLTGHQFEITAVAVSHGGDLRSGRLFTGDANGQGRLWKWDQQQWRPYAELAGHLPGHSITAARFLPGNRQLLTACQDHTVARWDALTGRRVSDGILKHPDGVRAMEVSPDGRRAVTLCLGSDGYRLTQWDLDPARELQTRLVPDMMVTSLAWGRDAREVLVAASDTRNATSAVWRWDLASGEFGPLWPDRVNRGSVWAVVPSPAGTQLLTVGASQARLWDAASGHLRQTFSSHGPVTAVNFSPSGKRAVTASIDGSFKIWNVDPAAADFRRVWLKKPLAHSRDDVAWPINSAVFSPVGQTVQPDTSAPSPVDSTAPAADDGDQFVLTAGDDGTAKLWDPHGQVARELRSFLHSDRVRSAVFSPDGKRIATACQDGTVHIWDIATGEGFVLGHPKTHDLAVLCVEFSADGKWLATGSDDNSIKLWELATKTERMTLKGHTASISSVAFSPDGRRVVSGSQDGLAKVWDAVSGNQLLSLRRHAAEVTAVGFSRDGRRVLTASADQTAIIWLSDAYETSAKE